MTSTQQAFLDRYLETLPAQDKNGIANISASYFGGDESTANECARLIQSGIKRATCSLKVAYDIENEPLPGIGRLLIVLDWYQTPVCIVKITNVSICRFNEVTAEFAYAEGEGDKSYQWWRAEHLKFFTEYAKTLGMKFDESAELVLEQFELVYSL